MSEKQPLVVEVDPESLIIDWVIDRKHVDRLKRRIQEEGGVKLAIWLWSSTGEIIDGLHRAQAALELKREYGAPVTIPAIHKDIDADTFWNLRISAAVAHRGLKKGRLHDFILQWWNRTKWKHSSIIEFFDAYRLRTANNSKVRSSQGETIIDLPEEAFRELGLVLREQAEKWQTTAGELSRIVVTENILRDWELNGMERRLVTAALKSLSVPNFRRFLTLWTESHLIDQHGVRKLLEDLSHSDLSDITEDLAESESLTEFEHRFRTKKSGRTLPQTGERTPLDQFVSAVYEVHSTLSQLARLELTSLQSNDRLRKVLQAQLIQIIATAAEIWPDPFRVWLNRLNLETPDLQQDNHFVQNELDLR